MKRPATPNIHLLALLLLSLVAVALPPGYALAEVDPGNLMCPVTPSETVDREIYTDFEGRRVYFCCQRCRRQFEANPAEFTGNLPSATSSIDEHGHVHDDHGREVDEVSAANQSDTPLSAGGEPPGGGAHTHDHATDHAPATDRGFVGRSLSWIGRLHPLIVHFPIALLVAAALAEGIHAIKGWPRLHTGVYFMIYIGAASAVAAAVVGWLNAAYGTQPESMATTLSVHRWLGVATAVWSVALAWHAWGMDYGGSCRAFRINLAIAVILVGATGHFGGTLVFGEGYFTW